MSYKRRKIDLTVRKKNLTLILGLHKTSNYTQNTQSSASLLSPSQKVSQAGVYSAIMTGVVVDGGGGGDQGPEPRIRLHCSH
jgi:hypothetical protein